MDYDFFDSELEDEEIFCCLCKGQSFDEQCVDCRAENIIDLIDSYVKLEE